MLWIRLLACLFLSSSTAQMPPIGIIDFYGLHNLSENQARQALKIKEGDSVPASLDDAVKELRALPGVEHVHLSLGCCDSNGKSTLYIGIEEKGFPALRFRPAPKKNVLLPDDVVEAGRDFLNAIEQAVLSGDAAEDESQGHALTHYPAARAIQEQYIKFAARDLKQLRDVLHNSNNAEHRAVAAQVIAYTKNKQAVVSDLVAAIKDPDDTVRNNAMRALGVMAQAQTEGKLKIRIPWSPFVEMLNSSVWKDRNKSSLTLMRLTQKRDPVLLAQLRDRALESLVEMARWKDKGHAGASLYILGRIAGISDKEIFEAFDKNNREAIINAATKRAGKKP
ncbi:MAG TPA: HEAT repeat domain-containing protein [Blastocatellia bacterium]|nr:HEAT repeat domain-containing protein [Blastocatellia bacterium]